MPRKKLSSAYKRENMLTDNDLPQEYTLEEKERLKAQASEEPPAAAAAGSRLVAERVSMEELDAQMKTGAQTKQLPLTDNLLGLSSQLYELISIKKQKFTVDNYLAHAQQILETWKALSASIPKEESDAQSIVDEIYGLLEDSGWQCVSQPEGLLPASESKLRRFLDTFNATVAEKGIASPHEEKSLLELSKELRDLFNEQKKEASKRPQAAASAAASSAAPALSVLEQLIQKIKGSQSLYNDPLIMGDPTIADKVNTKETNQEDLGFTALFYAAKYTRQAGSIARLLAHAHTSLERSNSLKAILSNNNNPYVGTRPLMICARFGTAGILKEILEQFTLRERPNQVNFTVKKGPHEGWTALLFACGSSFQSKEELNVIIEKVIFLLENNADINAQTKSGKDSLILAIENNNALLFRLLIQHGISPNASQDAYRDAVDQSDLSEVDKQEILRKLNLDRPTTSGLSPATSSRIIQASGYKRKPSESPELESVAESEESERPEKSRKTIHDQDATAKASAAAADVQREPAEQHDLDEDLSERPAAESDTEEVDEPTTASHPTPADIQMVPREEIEPHEQSFSVSHQNGSVPHGVTVQARVSAALPPTITLPPHPLPQQPPRSGFSIAIRPTAAAASVSVQHAPTLEQIAIIRQQRQEQIQRREQLIAAQKLAFQQYYLNKAGELQLLAQARRQEEEQVALLTDQLRRAQDNLQRRVAQIQEHLTQTELSKEIADNANAYIFYNPDGSVIDITNPAHCRIPQLHAAYAQAQTLLNGRIPQRAVPHPNAFFSHDVRATQAQRGLALDESLERNPASTLG